MNADVRPIAILIAALGGQGGGVLAEWLVDVATKAGYLAQSTSIPGVAQRTGATTYYVEIFPEPVAALGRRRPMLSLLPVPGRIDLLVASELLEAVRIVQSGMATPERTLLIASSARTLTTIEKMAPGDGRYDAARLAAVARRYSRQFVAFDMEALARDAGTSLSSVMCGAIAASGILPIGRDAFEEAIRASGLAVEASLDGFARGWNAVAGVAADAPAGAASTGAAPNSLVSSGGESASEQPWARAVAASLPAAAQDFAGEGYRRLVEYQDSAYAERYVQRLRRVAAAETRADPGHAHGHATTRETARFLALWMAFDDVPRVADLKSRASRFARVRREVGARSGDVVAIVDYFKPGVPEIAGLLPAALARVLLGWDRRRQSRGEAPLAVALHVRTHTIAGFVALRTLAALRRLRRRGVRYAQEQAAIERWLGAIEAALANDWTCGHEAALCGRLVKGYGATNERGKRNLAHIVDHLVAGGRFASAAERAAAIRHAREAALADEEGRGLDAALARHGAPPRPIVAQPIRFVRRA